VEVDGWADAGAVAAVEAQVDDFTFSFILVS
jgi:hypothetical protein